MRTRVLSPFLLTFALACGGAATDDTAETAMADDTQEYAAGDAAADVAAVEGLAQYWETHYNMGHGSMVASTLDEQALMWSGDGTMLFGREAIEAQLNAEIETAAPQMDIEVDETMLFGDAALMRGTYSVAGSAEGQAFTNSGYWVAYAEKGEDGEWKNMGVVGNLDSADQPSMPGEKMPLPTLTEEEAAGTAALQERLDYYQTHFNMGHASMVAETYTGDAVVMGSGQPMITGRAAAEARLQEMIDAGVEITEATVWAGGELDESHHAGVGTYTLNTADGAVNGHFVALYERGADGTLQAKWLLTSNHPSTM